MRVKVLAFIVLAVVTEASAQKPPPLKGPLASAKSLSCSFPAFGAVRWGTNPLEPVTGTQEFSFQVDSINYKRAEARIVATGTTLVNMILTQTGMNLVEQTRIGNLNLTTIFAGGAQGQKFLAVHSRHIGDLESAPQTSQAYGTCDLQ
jgi:hypothetical protein